MNYHKIWNRHSWSHDDELDGLHMCNGTVRFAYEHGLSTAHFAPVWTK